jgi:hypothetical protein
MRFLIGSADADIEERKSFFYSIMGIGDESIGHESNDGDIDSQRCMEVLDMNLMMDISTFNICPEHISKSFARLA